MSVEHGVHFPQEISLAHKEDSEVECLGRKTVPTPLIPWGP